MDAVTVEANNGVAKIDDVKMHCGIFWYNSEKDFIVKALEIEMRKRSEIWIALK